MGNNSQLIFYGFCILLVNNIANSDATFLGLFSQASGTFHPPAPSPRIAPLPTPAPIVPTGSGAAAGNSILLTKLTQISTKLNQLLSGLGNTNGHGAATGTRISTEQTAAEISPKIDDDAMTKEEETEMDTKEEEEPAEEEPAEEEAEPAEEEEAVKKPSNGVQTRTGTVTNGNKQGNGYELRKAITTSSSGRAASLGTGPQSTVVRVGSQPISPGVVAAISTSGGYNYQPTVQRTGGYSYQPQPTYQRAPVVQRTYYQAQPTYQSPQTVQRTSYQVQPTYQATVPRAGGYNYQNPGYQYRTVRYY